MNKEDKDLIVDLILCMVFVMALVLDEYLIAGLSFGVILSRM